MKQRIYIDTSVIGGYHDEVFKEYINIKNGYKQLEIRSPRDFEKYEDDE